MDTTILATVLVLLAMLTVDASRFRFHQKKMQKHDRVLFPFCQLRRDIIRFLYMNVIENTDSLSPVKYRFVRHLLDVLDIAIRNYNQYETSMFNVRRIVKHLEMYQEASRTALDIPDHSDIREFHERIRRLLVAAFLAYTPLIRWELTLRLFVLAYHMNKQDGTRRSDAEYVVECAEKVRSDARHYKVSLHYA